MATTTSTVTPEQQERRLPRVRRRPWWRRRPVHRALVVSHRWTSLVLGLVLIAITTSGAAVLYEPEWQTWAHPALYTATPSDQPMSLGAAYELVQREHPDFSPGTVNAFHGIYEVLSTDGEAHPGAWLVDPGRAAVTGFVNPQHGVMGFFVNLHECALTCGGYTGYVPFLGHEVPGLATLLPGATWGTLILALMGVLLVFLAISGLVLWWPGLKRWSHGFRVRWRQSRYTRDFDLHQLAGLVAVPFLLMWGITGSSFELPLDNAWFAVTGATPTPEDQYDFTSNKPPEGATDIGLDAAIAAAARTTSGTPVYASVPSEDGTDGSYGIYLSAGVDPYAYGHYPGQVLVDVDRYDASHVKQVSEARYSSLSHQIWDNWRSGLLHYGYAVNGWWRLIWFAFGLAPLMLAWTGVSTWLYKRGVARRRAQARRARAADPTTTEEANSLIPTP
ncbi:PepSY-associated TM helix domain-containing protein [uncultured Friedmanniella sp.]|uniref:PepSY-associated TM helix domain-containing protein n=1 Tax=uncultured Friedmanniella sp. TaxID=335381 RepID=UPI0035CA36AD